MTRHIPGREALPADPASDEHSSWRRSSEVAVRAAEAVKQRNKDYRVLAERVTSADQDGIRARWEFGKALVAERGDRKKLPDGRLAEVCLLVDKREREVQQWMAFAETYPTEDQLRTAMRNSWTQIKASLTRAKKDKDDDELAGKRTLAAKHTQGKPSVDRLGQYAVPGTSTPAVANGSGPLDKYARPDSAENECPCGGVCPCH